MQKFISVIALKGKKLAWHGDAVASDSQFRFEIIPRDGELLKKIEYFISSYHNHDSGQEKRLTYSPSQIQITWELFATSRCVAEENFICEP